LRTLIYRYEYDIDLIVFSTQTTTVVVIVIVGVVDITYIFQLRIERISIYFSELNVMHVFTRVGHPRPRR
jgi:hypothetical protein